MGADVTILDRSIPRLRYLDDVFGREFTSIYSTAGNTAELITDADMVCVADALADDAGRRAADGHAVQTGFLATTGLQGDAFRGELRSQLGGVIAGRRVAIDTAIACLLAGGHLLIEDVPGVGKTVLAHALATSVGGSVWLKASIWA